MTDVEHTRLLCGGFFVPGQCFARLRRRPEGDVLFLAGAVGGPSLLDGLEEAVPTVWGRPWTRDGLRVAIQVTASCPEVVSHALVTLGANGPILGFRAKESLAAELGVEEAFLEGPPEALVYAPPPAPAFEDTVIPAFRFRASGGEGVCWVKTRVSAGRTLVLIGAIDGRGSPSPGDHLEAIVAAVTGERSGRVAVAEATADGQYALVQMNGRGPCWHYTTPSHLAAVFGVEEAFFAVADLRAGGTARAERIIALARGVKDGTLATVDITDLGDAELHARYAGFVRKDAAPSVL